MFINNKNKQFTYFTDDFGRIKRAFVIALADMIGVAVATFVAHG